MLESSKKTLQSRVRGQFVGLDAARTSRRVSSSACSGHHPVAATSLLLSPRQHGHIDGAHQLGIDLEGQIGARDLEHAPGQVLDGDIAAGAHVVGLARLALLGEESVGAHDVTHVGEVATGS